MLIKGSPVAEEMKDPNNPKFGPPSDAKLEVIMH